MYVPDSLKLNKFVVCNTPSSKELFTRFGFCTGRSYTGDEVAPPNLNKVDMMLHFDLINQGKLDEESKLDATK